MLHICLFYTAIFMLTALLNLLTACFHPFHGLAAQDFLLFLILILSRQSKPKNDQTSNKLQQKLLLLHSPQKTFQFNIQKFHENPSGRTLSNLPSFMLMFKAEIHSSLLQWTYEMCNHIYCRSVLPKLRSKQFFVICVGYVLCQWQQIDFNNFIIYYLKGYVS